MVGFAKLDGVIEQHYGKAIRMLRIGIIGYGGRIRGVFGLMQKLSAGTNIVAITEIDPEGTKANLSKEGLDPANVRIYSDADEMLANEELDGVMIGTRCSLHAQMAVKVLAKNLPFSLRNQLPQICRICSTSRQRLI